MSLYTYRALITAITDGDTIRADLDVGFDLWLRHQPIRLAHLNAPESNTVAGKEALAWLAACVGPLPATVTLQTIKDRHDKYGRYLGVLITDAGVNVNEALLAAGHAVPYEGRGKAG